jgi:hypothetical protein
MSTTKKALPREKNPGNTREPRSLKLIADFVEGYAKGWYFAIGDCFRACLDIKQTPRIYKSKNSDGVETKTHKLEWTQGKLFSFEVGNIIYNTSSAYKRWPEGLKDLKYAIHVKKAEPNRYKPRKAKEKLEIIPGFVEFLVYLPNETRTEIVEHSKQSLSQNEFVAMLREGPPAAWRLSP